LQIIGFIYLKAFEVLFNVAHLSETKKAEKIEKIRIPKESPTRQNLNCCRLGLIKPVHGQHCQVQTTVHAS
jgi:hypothetical protein